MTRSERAAALNIERLAKAMEEVGGTPETIAKARVQPDILDVLLDKGVIDGGQLAEALAIRRAWHLITQPAQVKLSSLMRVDGGGQDMAASSVECLRRYKRWAFEMVHERKDGKTMNVVLWVCVDGCSFREIAPIVRMGRDAVRKRFLAGLAVYHAVKRIDRAGPAA